MIYVLCIALTVGDTLSMTTIPFKDKLECELRELSIRQELRRSTEALGGKFITECRKFTVNT